MSTRNDTCPACGDVQTGTRGLFACGSTTHPWGVNMTVTCVARQSLTLHQKLTARIAALEAHIARLEEAGDSLAKAAETYGIPYHGHLPSIWTQAKEAKP